MLSPAFLMCIESLYGEEFSGLEKLVKENPDVLRETDNRNMTLLMMAAEVTDFNSFYFLLEKMTAQTESGEAEQLAQILDIQKNTGGGTVLHILASIALPSVDDQAEQDEIEMVLEEEICWSHAIELVLKYGGNVYLQDFAGDTALHYAICNNNLRFASTLLDFGQRYLATMANNKFQIAFDIASELQNVEAVEMLAPYADGIEAPSYEDIN